MAKEVELRIARDYEPRINLADRLYLAMSRSMCRKAQTRC